MTGAGEFQAGIRFYTELDASEIYEELRDYAEEQGVGWNPLEKDYVERGDSELRIEKKRLKDEEADLWATQIPGMGKEMIYKSDEGPGRMAQITLVGEEFTGGSNDIPEEYAGFVQRLWV